MGGGVRCGWVCWGGGAWTDRIAFGLGGGASGSALDMGVWRTIGCGMEAAIGEIWGKDLSGLF